MFRNLYSENIKLVMHWSEDQYEIFCDLWEAMHFTYISELRQSYVYSEDFFDLLLSLYFVSLQTFNVPLTIDKKASLLSLLLFNSVFDDKILHQSEESVEALSDFLRRLVDKKLISNLTRKTVVAVLDSFVKRDSVTYSSDIVTEKELSFIEDMLISTYPVILDNKHVMFYYDNPHNSKFAVSKPYPTPTQFFDAMFNVSRKIDSEFLRKMYMERLYRLMDAQSKKSIFPF